MECRLFARQRTYGFAPPKFSKEGIYLQFVSAHTPNHEEENDGAGDRHNFYPQNSRNASVCDFFLSLKTGQMAGNRAGVLVQVAMLVKE